MTTPGGGNAAAMVAAGPMPGGFAAPMQAPKYIGVPDGYVVPGRAPGSPLQADRPVSYAKYPRYTEDHLFIPRTLSPERIAELQADMKSAGLYSPRAKFRVGRWDEFSVDAYHRLLTYANQGGISDREALQELLTDPATGRALSGQDLEDAPFTGTRKRRNKSVDLTNPQSARARLRSVLREELGRSPSDDEVREFVAALNASERANPVISDQTLHIVEDELTGTDSVQSGGVDPAAFTDEFVLNDPKLRPEMNSFTRDTDYYQAAMSVLGEGGGRL